MHRSISMMSGSSARLMVGLQPCVRSFLNFARGAPTVSVTLADRLIAAAAMHQQQQCAACAVALPELDDAALPAAAAAAAAEAKAALAVAALATAPLSRAAQSFPFNTFSRARARALCICKRARFSCICRSVGSVIILGDHAHVEHVTSDQDQLYG